MPVDPQQLATCVGSEVPSVVDTHDIAHDVNGQDRMVKNSKHACSKRWRIITESLFGPLINTP